MTRCLPRLFLPMIFIAAGAPAAVLEFSGTPARTLTASDIAVPVYAEATAKVPGGGRVFLTGAGVRKKTVVFVKVNVYTAVSYAQDPKGITVESALEGLGRSSLKAMQLTFLRDLKAEQVRDAFGDALQTNGVDPKAAPVKEVLDKIVGNCPARSTLTLVGVSKSGGTEELVVETPSGIFTSRGKGLVTSFWKIWFGTPADGGLEDLKPELLLGAKP